ncbi:MAG: tetratricopeptide repeat protein [Chloroflexi bacterium]|jgi:tetratricopeptide (TPR) repeat protein|nr:tetratricopeptide repeat protein [Chloroflexota bacterium]
MWSWLKAYLLYTWGGLHRYFGNANGVHREYLRAVHYFNLAYKTDPGFHRALVASAVIRYRELGEIEGAIAALSDLLQAVPDHGEARFNRALAYQEAGRYGEALADFRSYLQQAQPGDAYYDEARRMVVLLGELAE